VRPVDRNSMPTAPALIHRCDRRLLGSWQAMLREGIDCVSRLGNDTRCSQQPSNRY